MKNSWKKLLSMALVLTITMSLFTPAVAGAQESAEFEKEVEEVAESLEFVFEEASIKDDNGNIIGLDVEMIEEKFGPSPELDRIKLEMDNRTSFEKPTLYSGDPISISEQNPQPITTTGYYERYNRCAADKLGDFVGDFIPLFVIASVYEYLGDGAYYKAAQKIVKAGIKGSIWGIAAALSWIAIECTWDQKNY